MKKTILVVCVFFMICFVAEQRVEGGYEQNRKLTMEEAVPVTSGSVEETELPTLKLYAKGAVLMDAVSGRVLYAKNADEQLPMASTTKIMTLILALEEGNLEDTVTVSSYAASMPDVQLNIREGEQYRLKDLLYSMMLESHNDSAVAVAEHVGGSVEEFAAMMNRKAEKIGCEHTWYITPNGLDATAEYTNAQGEKEVKTHMTTATDLARVMAYCINESPCKEQFLEITRTPSYSFTDLSGKRSFGCTNHNAFLSMMDGALSGKTGFTSKAGYCYVGALKRDERVYTVALLACGWPNHKTYKWSDTRQLMEYGLKYYTTHSLDEAEVPPEVYEPIPVTGAQTEKIDDTAFVSVTIEDMKTKTKADSVLLNPKEEIKVKYEKTEALEAPVAKGQKVGEIYYMIGEEIWKNVKVVTTDSIAEIDWNWCLKIVFDYWRV